MIYGQVRRVPKTDLRRIAKATGATSVLNFGDMEGDETFDPSWLGSADEVFEERVADDDVMVFKVSLRPLHALSELVYLSFSIRSAMDETLLYVLLLHTLK